MRRVSGPLVVAGLLLSGCSDAPRIVYPTAPSSPSIPQTVTLTASNGIGASAGHVFLAAMVRDASGRGVGGATVLFTTTGGTVQPASVTSDGGGLAQATVTSSTQATITAVAGTAVGTIVVTPTAPTAPTLPNPTPPTPPSPAPGPPQQPLTVTILATPGAAGTATVFSLAAPGLQQETWSFGDSSGPVTTTNHTASHVYALAGTYSVGVTVIDTQGRTASATTNVTIPASQGNTPAPTSGLVVTMTCKEATHGSPTPCNLAATFNGENLPSTSTFTLVDWDWGDGTSLKVVAVPPAFASPIASHTYAQAGTYLVVPRVDAVTPTGPQTTTTSRSLTIP